MLFENSFVHENEVICKVLDLWYFYQHSKVGDLRRDLPNSVFMTTRRSLCELQVNII